MDFTEVRDGAEYMAACTFANQGAKRAAAIAAWQEAVSELPGPLAVLAMATYQEACGQLARLN